MLDVLHSLSLLALYLFLGFLVLVFFTGMAVLTIRGTPWYPFRRYAGNSTFNQHILVFPPSGHWNRETLEPRVEAPGHWNLGTLEPRVHREVRYTLGSHQRSLRCAFHFRAAHGGYDVLGGARWLQVQFLVSLFPRL